MTKTYIFLGLIFITLMTGIIYLKVKYPNDPILKVEKVDINQDDILLHKALDGKGFGMW